jgi:hypothetical protein
MPKNVRLTESKASLELQTYLISQRWWVRKTHGNIYQMGLPDLLVGRKRDGRLMLLELKIIQGRKRYTSMTIFNALSGPQIGVILLLAKIRSPVFIIARCPEGWLFSKSPFKTEETLYPMSILELYQLLNEQ